MIGARWDLGLSKGGLQRRVAKGEVTRLARGVYSDAPVDADNWLSELASLAVRYPGGRLAGQAAAALYWLDGFDVGAPPTIYRDRKASARGGPVRRLDQLEETEQLGDLEVCGVGELLLGLGAEVEPRPGCAAATALLDRVELVELAVEAALRKELVTIERLERLVATTRTRPGRAELAQVLAMRPPGAKPTGSYLETRCVQVLRTGSLPDFERQVDLYDSDGLIGWVDLFLDGVVIELVGKKWHLEKFDPDHVRYARLAAAGYALVPFTFSDVEHHPRHVVDATRSALRQRGL